MRRLRDLTRYRTILVRKGILELHLLEKVLGDAGIKLTSVATHALVSPAAR